MGDPDSLSTLWRADALQAMINSPFTLVHRRRRLSAQHWDSVLDRLPGLDSVLARHFQRLPEKLQRSLSDSLINLTTTDDVGARFSPFHKRNRCEIIKINQKFRDFLTNCNIIS